jgi:hypothetical protein
MGWLTKNCFYPLVIEHNHGNHGPFIHGLPIKNGGSFHGYVTNIQRVTPFVSTN